MQRLLSKYILVLPDEEVSEDIINELSDEAIPSDGESSVVETNTEYQAEVVLQLQATNELLVWIFIIQLFLVGLFIFSFVYKLIRSNIINHFV